MGSSGQTVRATGEFAPRVLKSLRGAAAAHRAKPYGGEADHDFVAIAQELAPDGWDDLIDQLSHLANRWAECPGMVSPAEQERLSDLWTWLRAPGVGLSGPAATPERLLGLFEALQQIYRHERAWASVLEQWLLYHVGDAGPVPLRPVGTPPGTPDPHPPRRVAVTWDDVPLDRLAPQFRPLLADSHRRGDQPSLMACVLEVMPAGLWDLRTRWPEVVRHVASGHPQTWPEATVDGADDLAWAETHMQRFEAVRALLRRCDWTTEGVAALREEIPSSGLHSFADLDTPSVAVLQHALAASWGPADWATLLRMATDRRTGEIPEAIAEVVAPALERRLVAHDTSFPVRGHQGTHGVWQGANRPERLLHGISDPRLLQRLSSTARRKLVQHPDQAVRLAVIHSLAARGGLAPLTVSPDGVARPTPPAR